MNQESMALLAALPVGALVCHWLKHDKRSRAAQSQARDAAVKAGKEASLAAMVAEQAALEDAELAFPAKSESGYKTAVALSPWDVFKGRMVKGARLRVRGDVFTRLANKWNSDEEHLRKNQPAGVYLVCKPEDVVFE